MFTVTASHGFVEDPLRDLLTFHRRIRASLAALDELSHRARGEQELDRDQAAYLAEFFRGPLLWHEENEEELFLPRLHRVRHSVRLERILAVINEAHRAQPGCLEPVIAHLVQVAYDGYAKHPDALVASTERLIRHVEPHVRMEDQELIPLARLMLSDEDLAHIERERRARRHQRRTTIDDADLV